MNTDRHFDYDPPPSHSPRLYPDAGAIPHARRTAEVASRETSESKLRRLRLMAIIKACRDASPPVPFSTLIGGLGIPETTARRLYNRACRMHLRRSRV